MVDADHGRMVVAAIPLWGPLVILVVGVVSSLLDDWRARRSLQAWAVAEGYELVEYRRASPWEAPYMYLRGSKLITWRVTVRSQRKQLRTGLVSFMFVFLGVRNTREVEVTWDEQRNA